MFNLEKYLPLVEMLARKYTHSTEYTPVFDYDDAFQEGIVGLLEGMKKYNPEKAKQITWAYIKISFGMKDARKKLLRSPRHSQFVNVDDVMLAVPPVEHTDPEPDTDAVKKMIKETKKELLFDCRWNKFQLPKGKVR